MPQTLETLTTRFEADISKMEGDMKRMESTISKSLRRSAKEAEEAGSNVGESFSRGVNKFMGKGNVGEAFEKVFSSARVATLEAGGERLSIFGGALEALGPVGLAAAAAIGAVTIAAEGARKAMEWSEELNNTAKTLGVTTTQLQQFDYASTATGVGLAKGREALSAFSEKMGALETHTGDVKLVKYAAGIKLTADEARNSTDKVALLGDVMEKIAGMANSSSRAKYADGLGLTDLLPVLNSGKEGVEEFISKIKEAQSVGAIVNPDDIKRAAELNDKVEALTYVIGQDFRKAFIDLAPEVEKVAEFIKDCADKLSMFIRQIPDAITGLAAFGRELGFLKSEGNHGLLNMADDALQSSGINHFLDGDMHLEKGALALLRGKGQSSRLSGGLSDLMGGKKYDKSDFGADYDDAAANNSKGVQLTQDKGKKDKKDNAAQKALELAKASADAQADAAKEALDEQKAELSARLGLAGSIEQRGKIEDQLAALGEQEKDAALDKKVMDARYDEALKKITPAAEAQVEAEVAKAKASAAIVSQLQTQLRDQQTTTALMKENIDRQDSVNSRMSDIANIKAGMAPTADERNAINAKNLRDNQFNETRDLNATAKNSLQIANDSGDTAQIQKVTSDNAEDALLLKQKQAAQTQQLQYQQRDPVQQYTDGLKDVNTQLKNVEVEGLQGVTDGITGAIMHTKSLGAAFSDVAKSIISDLIKIGVQKMITAPLSNMLFGNSGTSVASSATSSGGLLGGLFHGIIPGFATGTNSAPGGLAWVGERGKELVNLPRGSQVIPNHQLGGLGGVPNMQSPTVNHNYALTTVVNADQSVLTNQIQTWIAVAHQSAIKTATSESANQSAAARRNSLMR